MTKTSPFIILTLGTGLLLSASSSDTHTRADIDDLISGDSDRFIKYATLAPNEWLLDGNTKIAPDPAHIGFVSQEISDSGGNFVSDPVIKLTLSAVADVEKGTTLEFSRITDDFCTEFSIDYYNASDVLITGDSYIGVDDYNYFALTPAGTVSNVKFIRITFTETNTPFRHVRLLGVYVDGILFDESDLQKTSIIEDADPISLIMPSNVLDFTVQSDDAEFSVLNEGGIISYLSENQQVEVYEYIDEASVYMGRFYLESWGAETEFIMNLKAVDAIALTDDIDYNGHFSLGASTPASSANIQSEDLLSEIMADFLYEYDLDPSLEGYAMSGISFKTNVRDALHHFCFALSAYADCSRSNKINILPNSIPSSSSLLLTQSDLVSEKLDKLQEVLNVEVNYINFASIDTLDNVGDPVTRLFIESSLATGDYVLFMDKAQQEFVRSGTATITNFSDFGNVYYSFTCTVSGSFILDSIGYYDSIRNKYKVNSITENILIVKNANFVTINSEYSYIDISSVIFDWSQQRYKYTYKTFGRSETVGDQLEAMTSDPNKKILGTIVKAELDLAGGMVSKCTMVGVLLDNGYLAAGKYDDRDVLDYWTDTPGLTTYPVGYLNTQTETEDDPIIYLDLVIGGSSFDIGYIGWDDVGEMHIQIDGGTVIDVDTNTGSGTKTAESWSSGNIGSGQHIVKIWGGGSGGEYFLLDYIEVFN